MTSAQQILVVEDDAAIREGICDALAAGGYRVATAADGPTGLARALDNAYDLLLLDLVLPGGDGLEILSAVREKRPGKPVIILTARSGEGDRVAGLRRGADDYVVKPFSVRELLARVEAVLRRSPERPAAVNELAIPAGQALLARHEVRYGDGQRCLLSQRECDLLGYLAAHAGRAVSREEILTRVWQIDPRGVDTRTIDMTVARLREKLRDDPADPRVLLTVRGQGYMFSGPQGSEP